jgi:XRE family transcriptional regulator, regulator of sulfur utilization
VAQRSTTSGDGEAGGRSERSRATLAGRVGERLRERRAELERTLKDVAANADISVSYLSSVEKGGSLPSLPVLGRLAHALELTIADLLRDESQAHVRQERPSDGRPGVFQLSHDDLQLELALLVARPGGSGSAPLRVSGHDVFVYLRSGSLVVTVDGDPHELGPGDSLDAIDLGRVTWTAGDEGAVSVWAAGVARDRLAVR